MQKTNTLVVQEPLALSQRHTVEHRVYKQTHTQGKNVTRFVYDVRK